MPQEYSDRRRRDATRGQCQEEEGCHRRTVTAGGGGMPQEYSDRSTVTGDSDRRRRDATWSTVTGGGGMPQEYSDRRRRDATGGQ